jgi:hypothetical protein
MTYDYGKPLDVCERLGSIRMSAAERRDAIANLKRGEAIAIEWAQCLRPSAAKQWPTCAGPKPI